MDNTKYGWIDKKYVAARLNRDSIEVKDHWISLAVGKGNNYASTLLRISVELEDNKTNEADRKITKETFLMKCLPEGLMGTLIQEAGMWDKEAYMYKNVLPIIENYVNCKIGPNCLNGSNDSSLYNSCINKEIVLEDLSHDFKMADRREQLDYDHCVVVMKKLAKFHAGSVATRATHKEYIDIVGDESCFCESRKETNELYLRQPFKTLAEYIKDDPNLRKYSKGLKDFGEKFWNLILYATKPRTFNVLNHGDLWTNNILFKYDENNDVIDARLIDFQCCRYTTPAFDLQSFFMSSVKEEIRETKKRELVEIYVDHLNKELTRLGETTISLEDLYLDFRITDCYGLYASIFLLPISIREPATIDDSDDILDTEMDNTFSKCIKGKKYQEMLPKILEYYNKKGLFKETYDNSILKCYSSLIEVREKSMLEI